MKKFTLKDILSSSAKWEPPEKREPTPKKVAQSEKKPVKPAKIPEKTDYSREFIKKFNSLAASKSRWTIWEDFVVLFACSISNAVDRSKEHYDIREQRYLRTIKKYTKDESEVFPELAALVICALDENPEQDYLGKLFMDLDLGNEHNGQFFTPYHVCQLMADISCSLGDDIFSVKTVNDPACGAGATLIAGYHTYRKLYAEKNLNAQNYILMFAQDIDETVALMCYIQLSMLGIAAAVKVGNTLTDPMCSSASTENYWYTPVYFLPPWSDRRLIREVCKLMKGDGNEKV